MILSTRESQKIHNTIRTPPCTYKQPWHNVATPSILEFYQKFTVTGDSESEVNPLSCEECDFQAASNVGLKIHKSKKHEDIPQLDGESACESDTDEWWVGQSIYSLKIFQTYIDVLKDIENSSLSEEEKNEERAKVTNGRKAAFGDKFQWFPPWSNA